MNIAHGSEHRTSRDESQIKHFSFIKANDILKVILLRRISIRECVAISFQLKDFSGEIKMWRLQATTKVPPRKVKMECGLSFILLCSRMEHQAQKFQTTEIIQ